MLTFGYDIETTGLSPFKDKILTIQFRRGGINYIYKIWDYNDNEKEMILDFLDRWKMIPRSRRQGGDIFVVFNFKFDGPFLLTRCLINKIHEEFEEWKQYLWDDIIHGPCFIDLYQLLGDQLIPFAKWKKCLVGSYAKYSGKDMRVFYKNKEYDKIEEYVKDELESLEKIFYAIQEEPFYRELVRLRERLDESDVTQL